MWEGLQVSVMIACLLVVLSVLFGLGGALMLKTAGWVLTATGSYFRLFMICGSAYLFALLVLHLLAPRLKPVELD